MTSIALFNSTAAAGATLVTYHLAWMFHELGRRVLAVDLDPQSNLTSSFLNESEIETVWSGQSNAGTILGCVEPLIEGRGDIAEPEPVEITEGLSLIAGDLRLSRFEDRLSEAWNECLHEKADVAGGAFCALTAFRRVIEQAAAGCRAEVTLIDVGPNTGALNRSALIAADCLVIPLGADLFSVHGLHHLGTALRGWGAGWQQRRGARVAPEWSLPPGAMRPLGYVFLNPSVRENHSMQASLKWAKRIPDVYARAVLDIEPPSSATETDPNRLAMLKHFKSLMLMAREARKPMFRLTAADGAIGGHAAAVYDCDRQFRGLAARILSLVDDPEGRP